MNTAATRRRPVGVPAEISKGQARAIWIAAQRLDTLAPFGTGPQAVARAVEHLGYVQIDTINVIERCHHHILFNRIPAYDRRDLTSAQSETKTVFEYWTHALSYVPVRDFRYFVADMKAHRKNPTGWSAGIQPKELNRVLRRVRRDGALTISDIKDDVLLDKDHPWASRKPSKRALQAGFYNGQLMIARRDGMLKTYELTERHFGWKGLPRAATANQVVSYTLDRALRGTGPCQPRLDLPPQRQGQGGDQGPDRQGGSRAPVDTRRGRRHRRRPLGSPRDPGPGDPAGGPDPHPVSV